MASPREKLAIFDIDGTIFRSSLIVELVNGLVAAGIFPEKAKEEMEADYLAWLNRRGHYDNYIGKVVHIHEHYIKGVKIDDVRPVVENVIAWQKDRVYRYTRDLIRGLKGGPHFLLAISGSPSYIVSEFTRHMGFDGFRAREFETDRGVFTGRCLNDDYLRHKDRVLKDFFAEREVCGGVATDLKRSLAVGDTDSDIPMLEMVGDPIAFNPNRMLAEHARKKRWKIVVERKDVIYEVKDFSFGS